MSKKPDDLCNSGEVIAGCRIEEFIAAGGMGAVYRAHKDLLDLA